MKEIRFLRMAERQASAVNYRWRLGCVITAGSNLLSQGRVKWRHSPMLDPATSTFHAEEDALRRLPKGG